MKQGTRTDRLLATLFTTLFFIFIYFVFNSSGFAITVIVFVLLICVVAAVSGVLAYVVWRLIYEILKLI
jgi:uncharacterized membrane protein YccC